MPEPEHRLPDATIVYDGDCGLCRRAVRWLWRRTGDGVAFVPYQDYPFGEGAPTREGCEQAVHLVEGGDRVRSGAAACFGVLERVPRWGWAAWVYRRVPGFAPVSEFGYRWVARHRVGIGTAMRKVFGPAPDGPPR